MMIFGILMDLLLVDRQHSRIRGFCFWKRNEGTPSYQKAVTQYCNALGPGTFLHGARLALASQTPDFIKLAMS